MKKIVATTILLLTLLGIGVGLKLTQASGGVNWLITYNTTTPAIGKPVGIKVWAYTPDNITTYTVSCNITITNNTDVVLMDSFSGDPAKYSFSFWREGSYNVNLYCKANGETTEDTRQVIFHFPYIKIDPQYVLWRRPFNLTITPEANYTNNSLVYLNGDLIYNGSLQTTTIPNLVVENDSIVSIKTLGRTINGTITVIPPEIYYYKSADSLKVNNQVELKAWYHDSQSDLPYLDPLIHYTINGPEGVFEGDITPYQSVYFTPHFSGTYTVHFTSTINGVTIENSTSFEVLEASILSHNLTYNTISPWMYEIHTSLELDTYKNGTLNILVDGKLLANQTHYGNTWNIVKTITLTPGTHKIVSQAVFDGGVWSTKELNLTVPKYPYTIPAPNEITIKLGEDPIKKLGLPSEVRYYTYMVDGNTMYIYLYYRGNSMYTSDSKLVKVNVITPTITINVGKVYLEVDGYNLLHGANITIYGISESDISPKVIYEGQITGNTLELILPNQGFEKYQVVYKAGSNTITVEGEGEITIMPTLTRAIAYSEIVIVNKNPSIQTVYVGGKYYTPGDKIRLPPGEYRVLIQLRNGVKEEYSLIVEPRSTTAYVYYNPENPKEIWVTTNIPTTIVLESGRTITVGYGPHTLPEPPTYAYNRFENVVLQPKYTVLY